MPPQCSPVSRERQRFSGCPRDAYRIAPSCQSDPAERTAHCGVAPAAGFGREQTGVALVATKPVVPALPSIGPRFLHRHRCRGAMARIAECESCPAMKKPSHVKLAPPLSPPVPPPAPIASDGPWIPPEGRDERGRLLPGFGGRKPGSKNKTSREALAAVQDLSGDAIASLRTLVRQHNFAAVRYVLDATLPALGRTVELEDGSPQSVIQAVVDGTISPTEFAKISTGMKAAMDASELKELKNQVDALEELIGTLKR
jgi:hypothetical protein